LVLQQTFVFVPLLLWQVALATNLTPRPAPACGGAPECGGAKNL